MINLGIALNGILVPYPFRSQIRKVLGPYFEALL